MTNKCPFCTIPGWTLENEFAQMRADANPISLGHALIVTKRHIADYFELDPAEIKGLWELVNKTKLHLSERHHPDGFNVGINVGKAAGQTVQHVHVHLIPRYSGDIDDPRGGVRAIFPSRKLYPGAGV